MEPQATKSSNVIGVSVVIPTYNRGDALAETLRALARNDYVAARWEAIVVDDGSTEDINAIVGQVAEATGKTLHYLRQENAGPAAARNRGAMAASGHLLIFIDNDILVDTGFIQRHVDALWLNDGMTTEIRGHCTPCPPSLISRIDSPPLISISNTHLSSLNEGLAPIFVSSLP